MPVCCTLLSKGRLKGAQKTMFGLEKKKKDLATPSRLLFGCATCNGVDKQLWSLR